MQPYNENGEGYCSNVAKMGAEIGAISTAVSAGLSLCYRITKGLCGDLKKYCNKNAENGN
jgi:hypothetical protein